MEPHRELVQIFVPEGNRDDNTMPVDLHDRWVVRMLALCGELFGGATSYGRGVGVWQGRRRLCWDRVTVIEAWRDPTVVDARGRLNRLMRNLRIMGRALRQSAVAYTMHQTIKFIRTERES